MFESRIRAQAAILFTADGAEQHVSAQLHTRSANSPECFPCGDQSSFHVAGAAGHDGIAAVALHGAGNEGIACPRTDVPRGDHIGVTVEQQRPAAPTAGETCDNTECALAFHFHSGKVRTRCRGVDVDVPCRHLQPLAGPSVGKVALGVHLGRGPAQRGNAQEFVQVGQQSLAIDERCSTARQWSPARGGVLSGTAAEICAGIAAGMVG